MTSAKCDTVIRDATREDCKEIRRLIQELADFEKMPAGPQIDENVLERDGFDRDQPLFHCLVAHAQDGGPLLGYALYFSIYSTWTGHAMYMEDLYVTPSHRQRGIGKALIAAVAKKATANQCKRLDFSVLDWNPAQDFYKALGARNMTSDEGWHHYRIQGPALEQLSNHEAQKLD